MKTLTVEQIQQTLRDRIPANLVVAEHTELGHFYRHTLTNQLFASVTTKCGILDAPHLKKWAARLAVEHAFSALSNDPAILNAENRVRMDELKHQAVLVHQDQFEEAGDIGTRGHGFVEDYLKEWMTTGNRPADIMPFVKDSDARVFAAARSAELFCKEWNVIPIASEMRVASLKHKFAGTLDSLMMVLRVTQKPESDMCAQQLRLDGGVGREHTFLSTSSSNPNKVKCVHCGLQGEYEFALVDWKTSNSIDKVEYAMQTSAYWQALYEMTGLKPKRIYIVRLDKTQAKYEVRVLTNRPEAFRAFCQAAKIYEWLNNGMEKLAPARPKERISLTSPGLQPVA